jgi:hypothetical protein
MDRVQEKVYEQLIISAVNHLKSHERRLYIAEITLSLCGGSTRQLETRFGWSRHTAEKGIHELTQDIRCIDNYSGRGCHRTEELNSQLAMDIRSLVEPATQADPELKTTRTYTNLSAGELRQALIKEKGYLDEKLPAERTLRDILNRMGYRLKRIQKGKPLKKTKDTDAIFDNIKKIKASYLDSKDTLQISGDTKAKVAIGEYSRGGKNKD